MDRYNFSAFYKLLIYCSPVVVFWCVLIGGQYNVGVDYPAYYEMFKTGDVSYVESVKGEWLFAAFIKGCRSVGIVGQGIFFVIALIDIVILLYIFKDVIPFKYYFLLFFVFITVSGAFHNQMNGIRQYLAIYVLSLGCYCLFIKRYFPAILIFSATIFIHKSAILILPIIILIFLFRKRINRRLLFIILISGTVCSFVLNDNYVSLLISSIDGYAHYAGSELASGSSLIVRILKYFYLPPYFISIWMLSRFRLSGLQKEFFSFGICAYSLKMSLVSFGLVYRMSRYLEIFSCIPIVFLLIYLYRTNRPMPFVLLSGYLSFPYLYKILIWKISEYSYDFFLFS